MDEVEGCPDEVAVPGMTRDEETWDGPYGIGDLTSPADWTGDLAGRLDYGDCARSPLTARTPRTWTMR